MVKKHVKNYPKNEWKTLPKTAPKTTNKIIIFEQKAMEKVIRKWLNFARNSTPPVLEIVFDLSEWGKKSKKAPRPGIEPGPSAWQADILTTTPPQLLKMVCGTPPRRETLGSRQKNTQKKSTNAFQKFQKFQFQKFQKFQFQTSINAWNWTLESRYSAHLERIPNSREYF